MASQQSLPTFSPDMLTRMEPGMLTDEMKEVMRERGAAMLKKTAKWKTCSGVTDKTPLTSTSHATYNYVLPPVGTVPTEHRFQKGEFGTYLKKAQELHVNLKSTAH